VRPFPRAQLPQHPQAEQSQQHHVGEQQGRQHRRPADQIAEQAIRRAVPVRREVIGKAQHADRSLEQHDRTFMPLRPLMWQVAQVGMNISRVVSFFGSTFRSSSRC
jgi:hypothetical protein